MRLRALRKNTKKGMTCAQLRCQRLAMAGYFGPHRLAVGHRALTLGGFGVVGPIIDLGVPVMPALLHTRIALIAALC